MSTALSSARGYTYIWNDAQTDAVLADRAGVTRTFQIRDDNASGGRRELKWRFPSRAECTLCHTMAARYALGVTTLQMNRDHDYGDVVANQISTLAHLGVFTSPPKAAPEELPRLVDYRDAGQGLNRRARSYLDANCAHCHRKWGGGNAEFQLLATLPASELDAINVRPQQGRFGLEDPRFIAPGSPERSMILFRMKRLGLGRMPHVASNRIHGEAVELVEQWIRKLGAEIDVQTPGVAK